MVITKFVSVEYDAIYYQKVEDQKGFFFIPNCIVHMSAFVNKIAFVLLRSKHDENYGTGC